MSDVRFVLESLNGDSLTRLLQQRGLPTNSTVEEKRQRLARSYRGDLAALAYDLQKQELVAFFAECALEKDGAVYELHGAAARSKDELQSLLARFHNNQRVPAEFERREAEEEEEEEEGEDEDAEGGEDEDGADQPFGESEPEAGGDDLDGEVDPASFAQRFTHDWSRPQLLRRLIKQLDGDAPLRLREERFQRLVANLQEQGMEVQLPDGSLASTDSPSPGIETKVRLRRRGSQAPTPATRPMQFVPGGQGIAKAPLADHGYELALLRLTFLTALPDHARPSQAAWPDAFIAAATRGVRLSDLEVTQLTLASAAFALGSHSPLQSAHRLQRFLTPQAWAPLFTDFIELNTGFRSMAEKTVGLVRTSLGLEGDKTPATHPPLEDVVSAPRHQEKRAAAGELGGGQTNQTNHRDLGFDLFGPPKQN